MKKVIILVLMALSLSACNTTPSVVLSATVNTYCQADEATRKIMIREVFNSQLNGPKVKIECPNDLLEI